MRRRQPVLMASNENDSITKQEEELEDKTTTLPSAITKNEPETTKNAHWQTATTMTSPCKILWVLLHVLAVVWVAVGGVMAHQRLHTHVECDMTYSHRQFYEIDWQDEEGASSSNSSSTTSSSVRSAGIPYKLYKFRDVRDPRHYGLATTTTSTTAARNKNAPVDWCLVSNKTTKNRTIVPVLFVPGHGGNYQQGRSLGAHGLGLTERYALDRRATERILEQADFLVDVYAIDFLEEGTALHGFYFQRQTDYVRSAIQHLIKQCGYESISIVGHSMGGLVARAAAADLHSRVVDAIVTLGTPHARPILTWESSALQWHNRLRQQKVQVPVDEKPLVISIAGGLRDELIPPETCQLPNEPRYLSFLATEIMEMPQDPGKVPPALGMDHKAIVWCHNLLAPVRRILLSLHETRMQPTAKRIGAITDMLKLSAQRSIAERMPHQQVKLRSEYNFARAKAMETALLYHIEWLVWFYTLIGASCVYFSSSLTGMAGCLLLTWASGGNHYLAPPLLPLHSSMALILTANAMFSALNVVFGFVVVGRIKSNLGVYQAGLFASALVVGVIGGRLYAPCTFLFLLYGFLLIHLASLSGAHPAVNVRRERALAAWLTPLIVLFVGSDLILSVKTLAVHVDSWPLLALFPFLVVLRLWIVPKQPPPRLIQVIQMMCMLWLGSGAVVRPFFGIHPVAAFITVLVSLDIIIVKRSFPKSC